MAPDFDTWQRGIRRASCRVFAGFCLVLATLQSRALLAAPIDLRISGVTALGVLVLLTAAYRAWHTLLDTRDAWVFALLVTAVAADPLVMHRQGVGGDENPAFFLLAATFLAFIVTLRGVAVPIAITATAALYVAVSVASGGRALAHVLDEAVILATSQLSVWMLFLQLADEAVRADDAHRRTISAQAAAAGRAAEQETMAAAQRTLHDRVLAALILITGRVPDAHAVRAECRRAAQAVTALEGRVVRADGVVDGIHLQRCLEAEADVAAAATGIAVRVGRRDADRKLFMPARVCEAVCGAVAECLRNVGRHASVQRAVVVLKVAAESGLVVEVIDHGRGLPPGFVPGFGIGHSVIARLREVGGDAHVETLAGGGTRVTLRWQPPSNAPLPATGNAMPELTRIVLHPRVFAGGFAVVLLVGSLYLAMGYSAPGSGWADAAVCAGVVSYIAWCVLTVPWPRALRRAHHAGFLILPGLLAVGLYTAGEGALLGFESWVVGLAGIPVILLAMVRPARSVLALAALESGIVAAAAVLDPSVSPLDVLSPVTQTPMFVGLVVYGVSAIARVRRDADAHEVALSSALAQSEEISAREHALGSHYAWLSSEVQPFLEMVAAGEADPGQSDVRQRASVLALAVRDELAVPAQLPEAFRRHIASARRRGIRVQVRASDHWPSATRHRELEELLELLATDADLTDITLSLPQTSGTPRVVVRPRLSTLKHTAAVRLLGAQLLDIDEDDLASIITLQPHEPEYA